MPQTNVDWAFWVFSTVFLGFLLNVAAGLAANPISDALAQRQNRKSLVRSYDRKLSRKIDRFLNKVEEGDDPHARMYREFRDMSEIWTDSPAPERLRFFWLLSTIFLASSLLLAWLAATFNAPSLVPNLALLFAAIMLVTSLVLLVRYVTLRAYYKTWPRYGP